MESIPELMKLLRTKSMIRYLPPKGTAGLARSRVRGTGGFPCHRRAQCPTRGCARHVPRGRRVLVRKYFSSVISAPGILSAISVPRPYGWGPGPAHSRAGARRNGTISPCHVACGSESLRNNSLRFLLDSAQMVFTEKTFRIELIHFLGA